MANSIKLDIDIPDFGRVGPIEAQVIFRSPDGMSALQFVEIPQELHDAYEKAKEAELVQIQPFIEQGIVIMVKDHEAKMKELSIQKLYEKYPFCNCKINISDSKNEQ